MPARVSEISTFPALSSSLPQLLPRLSAVALCNVLPTNWQSTPGARVGAWLSGKGTLYPCRRAASSKRPCTSTLHPTLAPAPLPHRWRSSSLNLLRGAPSRHGTGKKKRLPASATPGFTPSASTLPVSWTTRHVLCLSALHPPSPTDLHSSLARPALRSNQSEQEQRGSLLWLPREPGITLVQSSPGQSRSDGRSIFLARWVGDA